MSEKSRGGVLVGLGTAVGAFAAAALMSAASAPTACADDSIAEITTFVDNLLSLGQSDFGLASTDFGNMDVSDGLAALFAGVDADLLSTSATISMGITADLTGETELASSAIGFETPTDFADAVTAAEHYATYGQDLLTQAASAFAGGDYAEGVFNSISGVDAISALVPEELILGVVVAAGL